MGTDWDNVNGGILPLRDRGILPYNVPLGLHPIQRADDPDDLSDANGQAERPGVRLAKNSRKLATLFRSDSFPQDAADSILDYPPGVQSLARRTAMWRCLQDARIGPGDRVKVPQSRYPETYTTWQRHTPD
ncbi:hypothetical protein AAE478_005456 [Parahypoxylon ruwenzoriense]